MIRLATVIFALCSIAFGATYYVAPNGLSGNPGTMDQPWSLQRICNGTQNPSPIVAGDTIYLMGGMYNISTSLICILVGTQTSRITLSAYPGELPVINLTTTQATFILNNGGIAGSKYLDVVGIAFQFKHRPFNPLYLVPNNPYPSTPTIAGALIEYVRIINCYGYGYGLLGPASISDIGTVYYGTVSFKTGVESTDRPHGPIGYSQNVPTNPQEVYEMNIVLPSWRNQHQIFSSVCPRASNFLIKKNFYAASLLIGLGGDAGTEPCDLPGNVITENFLVGGTTIPYLDRAQFVGLIAEYNVMDCSFGKMNGGSVSYNICSSAPNVTYSSGGSPATIVGNVWPYPSTPVVNVHKSSFRPLVANIYAFRHPTWTPTDVDVSGVLGVGGVYEIVDPYNVFDGRKRFIYNGGPLRLSNDLDATYWMRDGEDKMDFCWHVNVDSCTSNEDFDVYPTVGSLPTGPGIPTWRPAIVMSDKVVYYWNGSQWVNSTMSASTHSKVDPNYRIQNARAYRIEMPLRKSEVISVSWAQSAGTTIQAGFIYDNTGITWDVPIVSGPTCSNGVCSARIGLSYGGRLWYKVGNNDPVFVNVP